MVDRTAWRLCSANGWWSMFDKPEGYAKAKKAGVPAHDDHAGRDFTAARSNQLFLADSTEHRMALDEASSTSAGSRTSGRTGSSAPPIDTRMKSRVAVAALEKTVARRGRTSPVASCTRMQPTSTKIIPAGVEPSRHGRLDGSDWIRSRQRRHGDDFFSLLQENVLNRCCWVTREELRIAIVTWIERIHRRRRQAALGRLMPIEFEIITDPPAT